MSQIRAFVELVNKENSPIQMVAIVPLEQIPCCMKDYAEAFPTILTTEVTEFRAPLPWKLPFQGMWHLCDLDAAAKNHRDREHTENGIEDASLTIGRLMRFLEATIPIEIENAQSIFKSRLIMWQEPE